MGGVTWTLQSVGGREHKKRVKKPSPCVRLIHELKNRRKKKRNHIMEVKNWRLNNTNMGREAL